ncbi:MAG: hypothetical protein QW478_12990 [Candidatus Micrarchaeaceae archaeon]
MVNVTPTTPPAFPILETMGGNVYEIASVSGLGCADTVYSTTYNGTAYNIYAVLPPQQALQVIQFYEGQFGLGNIACNSLLQEASYAVPTAATTPSLNILGFNVLTFGGAVEFIIALLVIVALIGVGIKVVRWAVEEKRR